MLLKLNFWRFTTEKSSPTRIHSMDISKSFAANVNNNIGFGTQKYCSSQSRSYRSAIIGLFACKTYYEILGVPPNATDTEIKNAYYSLAKKMHPDVNRVDSVKEQAFSEINLAYQILKNPQKRRAYDMGDELDADDAEIDLTAAIEEDGLESLFDIRNLLKGSLNIFINLNLSLEQIINGGSVFITFRRSGACSECEGTGSNTKSLSKPCQKCDGNGVIYVNEDLNRNCTTCDGLGSVVDSPCTNCDGMGTTKELVKMKINIPPGLVNKSYIRIKEWGDLDTRSQGKGDLYIKVDASCDSYNIVNQDIHMDVSITSLQAVLGDVVTVENFDGKKIKVKILPGTQPDDVMELKNLGLPDKSDTLKQNGSLFLHWSVSSPKLTDSQLLKKLESLKNSIKNSEELEHIEYM